MNSIAVTGRLGKDVILKELGAKKVAAFSLAVDRSRKDSPTVWLEIRCWEKLAENCARFIGKGSRVAITGRLQCEEWQGRDGQTKRELRVVAADVTFLSGKSDNSSGSSAPSKPKGFGSQIDDSDIPF